MIVLLLDRGWIQIDDITTTYGLRTVAGYVVMGHTIMEEMATAKTYLMMVFIIHLLIVEDSVTKVRGGGYIY